jgi:hypothetical protein
MYSELRVKCAICAQWGASADTPDEEDEEEADIPLAPGEYAALQ